MKHTKIIGSIAALCIMLYAGYAYSLTVAQRKAKRTQFDQILSHATTADQLKPAQAIIDELKKTDAIRDARAMEGELTQRKAEFESKKALVEGKQNWQEEKRKFEVELRTANQNVDRFEKELNLSLQEMEKLQKKEETQTKLIQTQQKQLEQKERVQVELNKTIQEKEAEIQKIKSVPGSIAKEEVGALKAKLEEKEAEIKKLKSAPAPITKEETDTLNKKLAEKKTELESCNNKQVQITNKLQSSETNLKTLLQALKVQNLQEAQSKIQALQAAPKAESVKQLEGQITRLAQEKTTLAEQLKAAQENLRIKDERFTNFEEKTKAGCEKIEEMAKVSNEQIKLAIGLDNFDNIQTQIVNPIIQNKTPTKKIEEVLNLKLLPENTNARKKYDTLTDIETAQRNFEKDQAELTKELKEAREAKRKAEDEAKKAKDEASTANAKRILQITEVGELKTKYKDLRKAMANALGETLASQVEENVDADSQTLKNLVTYYNIDKDTPIAISITSLKKAEEGEEGLQALRNKVAETTEKLSMATNKATICETSLDQAKNEHAESLKKEKQKYQDLEKATSPDKNKIQELEQELKTATEQIKQKEKTIEDLVKAPPKETEGLKVETQSLQSRIAELEKSQLTDQEKKKWNRVTMAINAYAKAADRNEYQKDFLLPALKETPWAQLYVQKIKAGQKRPEDTSNINQNNVAWYYPALALPYPNIEVG